MARQNTTLGKMRARAAFQERIEENDGFGNYVGRWVDRFERWTNLRLLRGGETVMAARLEARQPAILTVRKDSDTDQITADWRVLVNGREYAIKEPPRPSDDRSRYELLCEYGVTS